MSDYRLDECETADPGVASLIPAQSLTIVEIDHEIISSLWSFSSLRQIHSRRVTGLLSVTSESMDTKYWLIACSSLPKTTVC